MTLSLIEYEFVINIVLLGMLAVTGLAIARIRSLFAVAMLAGLYSLLCASWFVLLDAVDVAFTEAAVGAGISTVLFLGALALTRAEEKPTPNPRAIIGMLVCTLTGLTLVYATLDMPRFGERDNPVNTHPLYERFTDTSKQEIGVPNAVTSVLASYRGYDTLGETVVIFTAGTAVIMLLGGSNWRRRRSRGDES